MALGCEVLNTSGPTPRACSNAVWSNPSREIPERFRQPCEFTRPMRFQVFDQDGNGLITVDELKQILEDGGMEEVLLRQRKGVSSSFALGMPGLRVRSIWFGGQYVFDWTGRWPTKACCQKGSGLRDLGGACAGTGSAWFRR